ncbi:endogenous retrovirus group K member 10 Gag polyprotein-like [Gopherus flavomarginatus]|uniref:endogenous retrovirus group K member 10 Gag polyprotein-like n=1 Tax=Gopherus flavomarginatus TaxID=286002 RepID=UPI0021CC1D91|nr:endogenous retrovirus group K member 10 Gag polyprotein-like [Gopherus flavomarginatus]
MKKNIVTGSSQQLAVWERVGSDLWESVSHGNKEAVSLSQIWCKTKKVVETFAAEAEVQAAVSNIFKSKEEPPCVLPVGAHEFFGGEETVITLASSAPEIDPSTVPLPQDSNEPLEKMEVTNAGTIEFQEEMKRQGYQLQEMLNKLSQLAGEDHPPQSHTLKTLHDYGMLRDAPAPGSSAFESNFMRNYKTKPPNKTPRTGDVATPCPRCGLWGCNVGCTEQDNPFMSKSPEHGNPFISKPPAYSSDTAGSGFPDPVRRWHGLIKEAHIEGEFLPEAFPVITPDPNNPARRQWAPLDWKLVHEAQKSIMSYGMNNPYVQSLIEQIFVGQAMCPYDSSKFADMLLTPTQRLLWKDNWSKRAEMALVHNIDLSEDNPLCYATQDMLMGTGIYTDPQRQARLDLRILQQSQGLALAAFKEVPQMGKPVPPYAKIVQAPSEPYSTFLDRLREAIDRSPNLTAEAKAAVGLDLATQNANAVCRRILATLPKTASLTEMVEACNRASIYEETDKAEIHAKAHASALAVALRPLVKLNQNTNKPTRLSGVCFACRKPGHMKKDCPNKNT